MFQGLMEKLNFNLNMFYKINTRTFKPMILNNNTGIGLHTIFQLDCVFVKNYNEIEKLDEEKLKKLILIMFYSYKSYDFVDYLISRLDKLLDTNHIENFRKLLPTLKMPKNIRNFNIIFLIFYKKISIFFILNN